MEKPIHADVTDHQPALAYENRLRIVGRRLDQSGYRGVSSVEVPGGMLVRAIERDTTQPVLLEILDMDQPGLLNEVLCARGSGERSPHHPLLPTGYEDFFRALGHRLNQQTARWVTVTELVSHVAVAGWMLREGHRQTVRRVRSRSKSSARRR